MTSPEDANTDPGNGSVETSVELEDGSIVIRAIEVVQYMTPEGNLANYVRWQGTGDIVAELGMLEYAKMQIYVAREAKDD